MPAKSQAQFEKMNLLYKQGKITKAQHDEFTKGVNFNALPKRLKPKSKSPRAGRR